MKKDFSPLLHLPQMADAILIHDDKGGIIGDGIEWFTNGRTSHVEIYVGGGEGKTIGARIDGVKVHRIDEYFKDHYTVTVRRAKGITVEQAAKAKDLAYYLVEKRYKYDIEAYFGFVFFLLLRKIGIAHWLKFDNTSALNSLFFCSEVFDSCMRDAGLDLFPTIGAGFVTPQDIMESDRLQTIIEV